MSTIAFIPETASKPAKIQVNTHKMSGKPRALDFDNNYQVEIDTSRQDMLSTFLERHFPNSRCEIIGAPWDYSQSEQPDLYNNTPIGEYRVRIDDQERLICVNLFEHEEALSLGGEIFEKYAEEGIDVIGSVRFPDEKWSHPVEQNGQKYYASMQDFRPDSKTFFSPEMRLGSWTSDLGTMIGQFYTAGLKVDESLRTRWKKFSEDVSIRSVKKGIEILSDDKTENDLKERIITLQVEEDAGKQKTPLQETFNEIAKIVKHTIPEILGTHNLVGTSYNAIDKMVVVNPNESLAFQSYHTVARGYVPMMTEHATHDAAFAASRIIAKPSLYDGDEVKNQIRLGLLEFIKGYNEQTSLSLSLPELIDAMKVQTVWQMLFGLGYGELSGGHAPTIQDLETSMRDSIRLFQSISEIDASLEI